MRQRFKTLLASRLIDNAMNGQELPSDRRESGIGNTGKIRREVLGRAMTGTIQKERLKFSVGPWVDSHACVPLRLFTAFESYSGAPVTDRVAFKLDWVASTISDTVSFLLLELVVTFGDHEQKPVSVTDILHVRQASSLAVGALAVGLVDLVFGNQLLVDGFGIFAFRDSSGHVPPVAVT